jgi:hypothetical protein
MNPFILLMIAVTGMGIHLYFDKETRSARRVIAIILLWLLPIFVGVPGLFAFLGHTFAADKIAAYIGWPSGNPFQFEVAVANLALGILGICCIWLRGNFWIATVIAASVFGFGTAYVHIMEVVTHHNVALGNAGPTLYLDIFNPVLFLSLLTTLKFLEKKERKSSPVPD